MYLDTIKKEECSGCSACVNICPQNAIEMRKDEEGFFYPIIDEEKCTKCGLCKKMCNKIFQPYAKQCVYGVKLKNLKERKSSSSGGAFVAISDFILENGGVVYGAGFGDNFYVMHKRTINKKERDELKKSKYVQSDLNGVFKLVKKDLKDGKLVLFSGTPCQVNGLKGYLMNCDTSNLYTCDLICHGVPSPRIYDDYLNYISNKKKSNISNFNFRDKKFGWGSHYETYTIGNKKYTNDKYRELFYSNRILRPSCYVCKYSNIERVSDITMGDFWGIEKVNQSFKDRYGVSIIIINSEKGNILFKKIKDDFEYISANIKDSLQHNLISPTEKPEDRIDFWKFYDEYGLEKTIEKYVKKTYDKNINWMGWFIDAIRRRILKIMKKKG